MSEPACRACRGREGRLVLDLGSQPACDYFPAQDDPGPDPRYPLQMWLCTACGLAQLVADPTVPEEPRGAEPIALVAQAAGAVERVAEAGLLPAGGRAAEYGSPHGGSWLGLLADRGLTAAAAGEPAEVVIDCFGLMHAADQNGALAERTARVARGGVLLLQYHALDTIVRLGQWNALRHGHYAYYSATALQVMLASHGFGASSAWEFPLYGGSVLLAARRHADSADGSPGHGAAVTALLERDRAVGVRDPAVLGGLERRARSHTSELRRWLEEEVSAGHTVLGYGAASRAVALLHSAEIDAKLLPAIADASAAKQGRRMPGTDIPVVEPAQLAQRRPESVLLFLSDLLAEVRAAFPSIEASGGRWVDVDSLTS